MVTPRQRLPEEALIRFRDGLEAAIEGTEPEPTAMTLSTIGESGGLSSRTVLMKDHGPDGFVFYTNTESRKGRQLAENARAALLFHWKTLHRQVQIEGTTEPVSDQEADEYFASRPRGSQIGAWASLQSEPLECREVLEQRVSEFEQRFADQEVPRPPGWSGYRLYPDMIEFWYGRDSRLHDRYRFTLTNDGWQRQRLYP